MNSELTFLDLGVFERATSVFVAKREALHPEAVHAVASEIMQRLAESRSAQTSFEVPDISEEEIAAFGRALSAPEPAATLRFIEDRRAEGLTSQGVYLGYIPGGARWLGERWDRDELSFLQVTSATGHLYALMRAMRAELPFLQRKPDNQRSALFATVPGEDHGIGITAAADVFRSAGWEIDLRTGADHDHLLAHAERMRPKIIGLSLSTERRLAALVRLVVALRLILPDAIIGVAPSSAIEPRQLRLLVDIDLVFADAPSAFRDLDRLVRLRA